MKTASRIGMIAMGALVLLAVTAGSKSGCGTSTNPTPEANCTTPADCEGLPHVLCVGAWQCVESKCAFACGPVETGCHSDADCGKGQHCSVTDGDCGTDPACPMCAVCYGKCVDDTPPQTCVQSGCSGEICAPEPMDSVCLWKPEYACLKYTKCGPYGKNGACAFAQTPEYQKCMGNPSECQSDADCPAGYYCQITNCGAAEAPSDPATGAPINCMGGNVCVPKEDPGKCYADSDCAPGEYCAMTAPCGACMPGHECKPCAGQCTVKESQCQADDQCPAGFVCQLESWCPACVYDPVHPCKVACKAIGTCVLDPDGCSNDAECKPGYVCDFSACYGAPADPAGKKACRGTCIPSTKPGCWSDDQCGAGYYCDFSTCAYPNAAGEADVACLGVCLPKPVQYCESDADCKEGYVCEQTAVCPDCVYADPPCLAPCKMVGQCVPKPTTCESDADCKPGQYCKIEECLACIGCPCYGTCVDKDPAKTCYSDYDCPNGYTCVWDAVCPPCACDPDGKDCPNCGPCTEPVSGICQPAACVDKDGDGFCVPQDCDDLNPTVNPKTPDVCDGMDNDCDGMVDEDCSGLCYSDKECGPYEYCNFNVPIGMACCPAGMDCNDRGVKCPGVCQLKPGLCWSDADCGNGETCEGEIVCPPGAMCFVADQPGKCVPSVQPVCQAVKPFTHGMCEMVLGYIFNGKECVLESGCSCGSDCAFFFQSIEACKKACFLPQAEICGDGLDNDGDGLVDEDCSCEDDSDCGIGTFCKLYCGNGWCKGTCVPNPSGQCVRDEDCAYGQFCKIDACLDCIGCPCFGTCQSKLQPGQCWTDADCKAGYYCEILKCGSGTKCIGPYQCVPK